jgi:hypothetical protein
LVMMFMQVQRGVMQWQEPLELGVPN